MAVFISVQTDPFAEVREQAADRQPQVNVRRPLRGLQIKKDTYAMLRVLRQDGTEIPLFDSSSPLSDDSGNGYGTSYSNFLLQQIQETRMEKQQIVETFGEDYIFFFGERPRFLNIQGILINTTDFNWKSEFWANYETYLRGTRLVEQNARVYLYFDDVVVEGYIVTAASTQQASMPYHLPFNFQFFVCNYAILSSVGSVFYQQEAESLVGGKGLPAPDAASQQADAAKAASIGAGGGLTSFLAASSQYLNSASFSVQTTLDNIRNTFYNRRLVVPDGIGNQLAAIPIENKAAFKAAPINRPIHEQNDEYVAREDTKASFDQAELKRVQALLKIKDPQTLELRARAQLAAMGVDTTRRGPSYLLTGRSAFAGSSTFGSFGIRQADGELSL